MLNLAPFKRIRNLPKRERFQMALKEIKMINALSLRNDTSVSFVTEQKQYIHQATSNNTRRAYKAAIKQFEISGGKLPATAQMIADYLTKQATRLNPRTLSLHLTALSHWHQYQELHDPTQAPGIRKLLKGIYRTQGKPKRKSKALQPKQIQHMIEHCEQKNTLKGWRNSALIQTAYFGAFRRSELITLHYEHLQFEPHGVIIMIPRSKTDQSGEGKVKALPYGQDKICPVQALQKWLTAANITQGPVFRSINRWGGLQSTAIHPESINTMIKTIAKHCGFDGIDEISSHSLRRGFATSAAHTGAEFEAIKKQGGWKNDSTVRGYIEEGQLFDKNAAAQLLKSFNDST